jgi:soluble lytic murein transglycosylase
LLACVGAKASADRVWGAHALARLGRFDEAARLFAQLAGEESQPNVRATLLLTAAYNDRRAGHADRGLKRLNEASPSRRWLKAALASARSEILFDLGELNEAAKAAQIALSSGSTSSDSLRHLLVRIAAAQAAPESFSATLRKMMLELPGSTLTGEAMKLAKGDLKTPALTPADWATRWARWSNQGGAQAVADECLLRLPSLPADGDGARAALECGLALSTIKHPEAERVLRGPAAIAALQAKASLAIARIQARDKDPKVVRATCDQIKASHSSEAADCFFLAAFLHQQRGQRAEAQAGFEEVIRTYPRFNRARDASWFLAFDAYQHERSESITRFDNLLKLSSGDDRAQVLYWRGRARSATDAEGARADWTAVTRLDPFGYYGWLAAARLDETFAPAPSAECATAGGVLSATPPAPARDAARLLELGFARYAAAELTEAVPRKAREALSWRGFLESANQFERIVLIGMALGGHGGPWPAPPDRRTVIEAAFPRAFPSALGKAAQVDRCLLLSLMRRESRFDPNATSAAQARGLLQLLPTTAALVAKDFGQEPPTADHLYDPQTNVLLASQYVQKLFERFGHPLLVAAAYNGGPSAVAKWTRDMAGVDFDEFVERIPFRETRNYVKAVGGSYAAYSLIYGGKRPTLSLEAVKPATESGVNY